MNSPAPSTPAFSGDAPGAPRVAVVLLNWNGWRDTLECLASLQNLTYPRDRTHVVLVDNASTDGSVERIRAEHPDLEIIEAGRNRGFGGGNNLGIARALALGVDHVWLLNTDTVVRADALTALVRAAAADERVGAVGAVLIDADGSGRVQAWGGGSVNVWTGHATLAREAGRPLTYVMAACVLLRRAALEQVGAFDERFFYTWEDTDLSYRLRAAGWRLVVAEDARVEHKETASVGKHSAVRARLFASGLVRFMRKHAPVPVVAAASGLALRSAAALRRGRWRVALAYVAGWIEGWRA